MVIFSLISVLAADLGTFLPINGHLLRAIIPIRQQKLAYTFQIFPRVDPPLVKVTASPGYFPALFRLSKPLLRAAQFSRSFGYSVESPHRHSYLTLGLTWANINLT